MTTFDRTPSPSLEEATVALRTVPFGGIDDTALAMRLPAPVQATVSPVIMSIRWGAAMFGMVFAAAQANEGDTRVVATLAVVLFLTTWRTVRPIRLGRDRLTDRLLAFTDAALIGLAVGWSGGLNSPFVLCLLAVAVVGAFGWGALPGVACLVTATVAMALGALVTGGSFPLGSLQIVVLLSLLATVALAGYARDRLGEIERRRASMASMAGRLNRLEETNDLLAMLNELARVLPEPLDPRESSNLVREQLVRTFDADTIALLVYDEASDDWRPHIAKGCTLQPAASSAELHPLLREAAEADHAFVRALRDGAAAKESTERAIGGVGRRSRSGLYAPLRYRNRPIGVIAIESDRTNRYRPRDIELLDGAAEIVALTVDNARSFTRLKSFAADEERRRMARDLHDRLGQWLTYISLELERIITTAPSESTQLQELYGDVQRAIEELRDTLYQFRAAVTEERPLDVVAAELVERFNRGGDTAAELVVTHPELRLPVKVENELLRILQEALSNITKHAAASHVDIVWDAADGRGTLTIRDDGRGFDLASSVRDSAYGLVGMRERADNVGARMHVESAPGSGTCIVVEVEAPTTLDLRADGATGLFGATAHPSPLEVDRAPVPAPGGRTAGEGDAARPGPTKRRRTTANGRRHDDGSPGDDAKAGTGEEAGTGEDEAERSVRPDDHAGVAAGRPRDDGMSA